MDLLKSRPQPHCGKLEIIVFSIYLVMLSLLVAHHQSWADDAQGWLLARDAGLGQLFSKYLHYEGSPGAWHFLLWMLVHLHVSFAAMHWIAAGIAAAGVWLVLIYSPFPPILRAILPFTFYLAYQYAATARSYSLFPLLIFISAMLFNQCPRRLILLAAVLGLLANLSAQGFLAASGLAAALAAELWVQREQLPNDHVRPSRLVAAIAIIGGSLLFAMWTAWPAPDNSFLEAGKLRPSQILPSMMSKIAGQSEFITFGLSDSVLLSAVLLGAVLFYLYKSGRMALFAPYIPILIFVGAVFATPYHYGMLFVTLIGILWIAWYRAGEPESVGSRRVSYVLIAALFCVCAEQVVWTYRAAAMEFGDGYSGDRQTAEFLRTHAAGKRVAGFHYWSVGVLAYFPSNIYCNQPKHGFWFWSKNSHVDDRFLDILTSRPDFVVLGERTARWHGYYAKPDPDPVRTSLESSGVYRETHLFCGEGFFGHQYGERFCQRIFEPIEQGQTAAKH